MSRILLLAACALTSLAFAAPEHSPRPGGIAVVDVGSMKMAPPEVSYDGKPVLVMPEFDRWKAVVGVPLGTTPGDLTVTVADNEVLVAINASIPFSTRISAIGGIACGSRSGAILAASGV